MLRYVQHKQVNYTKWNACIHHAVNSRVYAYTWYLDSMVEQWDALVYNNYEAVMPLVRRRKWGVHYLYQPMFTQQLGIFSKYSISQSLVRTFLQAIPSKFWYLDMQLNEGNFFALQQINVQPIQRFNYMLSLEKKYEQLQKAYSQNTKRNLKKAKQIAFRIEQNIEPTKVVRLFQKHQGPKIGNLKSKHYEQLIRLINSALARGLGEIVAAYDSDDELCAATFFILHRNRIIYLLPALTPKGRAQRAMFFLIDSVIQEYADCALLLDFEGSMVPSIARFYRGFGAKPVPYWQIHSNRLPKYLRWLKQSKSR